MAILAIFTALWGCHRSGGRKKDGPPANNIHKNDWKKLFPDHFVFDIAWHYIWKLGKFRYLGVNSGIKLTSPTLKWLDHRNGLSFGVQILHDSQPYMAKWLCEILPTWPKAWSSSIASFSTPVDKENMLRFKPCREQKRRQLALPCTPNILHANSPVGCV